MIKKTLRIATRQSMLALWQANYIKSCLQKNNPNLDVQLVKLTTTGDKFLQGPLSKIGGKGLFIKELENALLNHEADIAVHSMKDVPAEFPEGLMLAVICQRADARDALVANHYKNLHELPVNAVIGTSSLRRQALLHKYQPQWQVEFLRGNVDSRLKKLDENRYDAIILAAAGLIRLQMQQRISQYLDPAEFIPAAGQGALGIECRSDDEEIQALIASLNHLPSAICLRAERAMTALLEGGCQVPIGAYATLDQEKIALRGMVGRPDGSEILYANAEGDWHEAENIGREVAEKLVQQGADKILKDLKNHD